MWSQAGGDPPIAQLRDGGCKAAEQDVYARGVEDRERRFAWCKFSFWCNSPGPHGALVFDLPRPETNQPGNASCRLAPCRTKFPQTAQTLRGADLSIPISCKNPKCDRERDRNFLLWRMEGS